MEFYKSAGPMALGSKIRHVAEQITSDAPLIYAAYGTSLNPKWFPVFYCLSDKKSATVTTVADAIGHSHVSVSKILKEMSIAGLVEVEVDTADRRRSFVSLSVEGRAVEKKMKHQYEDLTEVVNALSREARVNLWEALIEWSELLQRKSLFTRVIQKKKMRESGVQIQDYRPKFSSAFRSLNEQWIKTHFKLEQPDIETLGNPKKYILDAGGAILVATLKGRPVGVCALIHKGKGILELAKMAVSPEARGKQIGFLLGQAAIDRARSKNAHKLFLESNTALKPAIALYRKLGFREVKGLPTPYERCNIQMELVLK